MQEQYAPIYHTVPSAIAIPKDGVVRLFRNSVDDKYYVKKSDGTIELFSAGAPEIQDLNDVLVIGNTTGGEDIIISAGDSLLFASGAFTATVDVAVLTGNQNIVFPDQSGTVALTSDIVTEDLQATLVAGNTTGGTDIIISAGDSLVLANGGFTNTVDTTALTGNRNAALQNASGTLAFLTDITSALATQAEDLSYAATDELTPITAVIGTPKVTINAPFNFTLVDLFIGLTTPQSAGATFTVDIKKNGVSIFGTLITIDNTEQTSLTALVPYVLTTTAFVKGDIITTEVTQVGAGDATGLKVYMNTNRA